MENKQEQSKIICPYELATDLKLNAENKWLELIQLAERQSI